MLSSTKDEFLSPSMDNKVNENHTSSLKQGLRGKSGDGGPQGIQGHHVRDHVGFLPFFIYFIVVFCLRLHDAAVACCPAVDDPDVCVPRAIPAREEPSVRWGRREAR